MELFRLEIIIAGTRDERAGKFFKKYINEMGEVEPLGHRRQLMMDEGIKFTRDSIS